MVFHRARDAVATAVAAQQEIMRHSWPADTAVQVRMGLHTGTPAISAGEYVGLDVHRAARICAASHGGQILVSLETSQVLADDPLPEVGLLDLGSHRLKDLQQPEKVFQILHPDLPSKFPPPRSADTFANNLPRQLSSFIGRERELTEVKGLLAATSLLTLTGSGGAGKTRLALQVGADVLEGYPDGVWVVELAALAEPGLVPQTAAAALGVREVPGRPVMHMLLQYLQPKKLLLILDNCEHLVAACAHLAEILLRTCPGVRILATSREVLGIAGETSWRVPSLSLPDPHQAPRLEELTRCEAVRLFVDRAAAANPTFALTPANALPVAAVVRHLDGIPLAIELAAARVPVLSVEQIAARLDDRFRLLTQGSRTTLPRHQTLRATLDWSYQLLTDSEQRLLRRLAVFAGGWTLEAAESVCQGGGIESVDVLDLLAQLVFKSLVLMDEHNGEVRYRFLETVRQYGFERLMESGESDASRRRHRNFFLKLAEQAEPELTGTTQVMWLGRLEAEHDNLRTVLESSVEGQEAEAGLRLAGAVWRFWYVRGYLEEGRKWLEALLKESQGMSAPVRAKALRAAGNLVAFGKGDYALGRSLHEESLSIWRELGDRQGIANTLSNLGLVAFNQGHYAPARALYEESLTLRRALGDRWGIAMSLNNLGLAVSKQGDEAAAGSLYRESLAIWRELGDKQHIAMTLNNLGLAASRRGNHTAARACFEESLALRRELGDKQGIAYLLESVAGLAATLGHAKQTARLLGAVEALREVIGAPLAPADRPDHDRLVTRMCSALGEGMFAAAWAEGRAMTLEQAISEALSIDDVRQENPSADA